jgi:hypothetical protein
VRARHAGAVHDPRRRPHPRVPRHVPRRPRAAPAARAAERLSGLIGKWDDKLYKKLFGARPPDHRASEAAYFADLRATHGACSIKTYNRNEPWGDFTLRCEHGGDLRLSIELDPSDEDRGEMGSFNPSGEKTCPVK